MGRAAVFGIAALAVIGSARMAGAQPGASAAEPAPKPPPPSSLEEAELAPWKLAGIGGGLFYLPARAGESAVRDFRVVALQTRTVRMLNPNAGWEITSGLSFHDWDTLECVWDWYTRGEDDEVGAKFLFLWPGLPVAAMGTASYLIGAGAVLTTGPRPPLAYVDFGLQMAPMIWRLSQPGLRFDIGFGGYVGLGFMVSEHVGASARISYDALTFHQLGDGDGYRWALHGLFTIDFQLPDKKTKK